MEIQIAAHVSKKVKCTPDGAQARRGLKFTLRRPIVSALTRPRSPTRLISAISAGPTSASALLRARRVQDTRLFEAIIFARGFALKRNESSRKVGIVLSIQISSSGFMEIGSHF
jgi:hypothetical protein